MIRRTAPKARLRLGGDTSSPAILFAKGIEAEAVAAAVPATRSFCLAAPATRHARTFASPAQLMSKEG